ncbi:MAG: HlyC/CorC family transporter [Pseudomonadota bacterium]
MNEIPLSTLSIALVILLCLSAFFSSSETALMALNRYRLRHRANAGHRGAKLAQALLTKPDRLIGVILLGNNLVNIMAASLSTVIAIRMAGEVGLLIAPFILTVIVLIFSEVAPKTWAAVHPESIAYPASFVLRVLLRICYPVVWVINLIANLLLRPFGLHRIQGSDHLSREELKTLLSESGGRMPERNFQSMLVNILDLEQGVVVDVMVPRNDVVGIDLEDDWDTILGQITGSFYTRLPVYEGDIDNVLGILHVRTVLTRLAAGSLTPGALRRAVRKPYFIPESTSLAKQLLEFQERERRMGLVVDEYGDIQGLLTLDDILEEIVGEFTTEPKPRTRRITRTRAGTLLVDGGENVRTVNRRLGWDLPTDGARTVNGLILEHLEEIPDAGTALTIGDLDITIREIAENAVRLVEVAPRSAEETLEDEATGVDL